MRKGVVLLAVLVVVPTGLFLYLRSGGAEAAEVRELSRALDRDIRAYTTESWPRQPLFGEAAKGFARDDYDRVRDTLERFGSGTEASLAALSALEVGVRTEAVGPVPGNGPVVGPMPWVADLAALVRAVSSPAAHGIRGEAVGRAILPLVYVLRMAQDLAHGAACRPREDLMRGRDEIVRRIGDLLGAGVLDRADSERLLGELRNDLATLPDLDAARRAEEISAQVDLRDSLAGADPAPTLPPAPGGTWSRAARIAAWHRLRGDGRGKDVPGGAELAELLRERTRDAVKELATLTEEVRRREEALTWAIPVTVSMLEGKGLKDAAAYRPREVRAGLEVVPASGGKFRIEEKGEVVWPFR